jgi:hypothetical protein
MQHGTLLAVIAAYFPAVEHEDLDFPAGENWVAVVGNEGTLECPKCQGRALLVTRFQNFNSLTGIIIYCSKERRIHKAMQLDHTQLTEIEKKVKKFLKENALEDSKKITFAQAKDIAAKLRVPKKESVTVLTVEVDPLVASVPVPHGYKNVAWLKDYEAQAVCKSYELKKSIPVNTTSGKNLFIAEYMQGTKDSTKYHADVRAVRIKSSGQTRIVGWIREEEALAVLKAQKKQADVEFQHENFGKGGVVQFFPEDSIAAKTYRSTTRLLRRM